MTEDATAGGVACQEVRFDAGAFELLTVKKAAYRILGEAAVDIRLDGKEVVCRFFFDEAKSPEETQYVANQLRKAVLDQDLRHVVAQETEAIRNAILGYALSGVASRPKE